MVTENLPPSGSLVGAPGKENMFYGWKIVKEDPVQYKDQMARGLDFLFGLVRDGKSQVDPTNRVISVYQKPEEGDFVVVSVAVDNRQDMRIFDITNEWYGDPEPDMTQLFKKVVEMADDDIGIKKSMHRELSEYGQYGIIETAGLFERFKEWAGIGDDGEKPSASIITQTLKSGKKPKAIEKAVATANIAAVSPSPQPSRFKNFGKAIGHLATGMAVGALKTIAQTSAGASVKNVAGMTLINNTLGSGAKSVQNAYSAEMKSQKNAYDEHIKERIAKIKAATDLEKARIRSGILSKEDAIQKQKANAILSGGYNTSIDYSPITSQNKMKIFDYMNTMKQQMQGTKPMGIMNTATTGIKSAKAGGTRAPGTRKTRSTQKTYIGPSNLGNFNYGGGFKYPRTPSVKVRTTRGPRVTYRTSPRNKYKPEGY